MMKVRRHSGSVLVVLVVVAVGAAVEMKRGRQQS